MTLDEKIAFVHGHSIFDIPYVGNVPALERLGIPPLHLEDGPQGVADEVSSVTAWPSAHTIAQTWSPAAAYAFGRAMAEEQYAKGSNIILAPVVNLQRVPWAGRAFEWAGEDPWLASRLVEAQVAGLQSMNQSACVKHAFANSQETDRMSVSENVGARALHELYLPAFAAAIDAGVGYAMCSYNRINGTHACENEALLNGTLKTAFGFQGAVMSDWYATHSAAPAAVAGLDQEMPGGFYFSVTLKAAVQSGEVPEARLDDMVTRILTPVLALGLAADPPTASRNIFVNATSDAHNTLARQLAENATVLLKNDGGLLPLNAAALKSIAVFGDETTVTGEGSGGVNLPYLVSPVEGVRNYLASTGNANVNVSYYSGLDPATAAQLASGVDVALVAVAVTSSEGVDRTTLALPAWHDALVEAVAVANPKTVVAMRCPGACFAPWKAAVPAIVYQGLPGQESGNALANVIFGAVSPAGRLAVSFPASMNDTWLSLPNVPGPINPMMWPGTDRGNGFLEADYTEELSFGYRFFDARPDVAPLWPFGHGLSYATFTYSGFSVSGSLSTNISDPHNVATVSFTVAHSGGPAADEVAQLYVGYPAAAGEPPQLLKGFQRVSLQPEGSAQVSLQLRGKDVAIYDEGAADWAIVPGQYQLFVGASSRDIRLQGTLSVA